MSDMVDVGPLREALQRSGLSPSDVARVLGWTRTAASGKTRADESRVRRDLGLRLSHSVGWKGKRYNVLTQRMRYERAVMYAEAIGVDPVEVGL